MLINFKEAKLRLQIKQFTETGAIPEAIYAGQSLPKSEVIYWAKLLLIVETEKEYAHLTDTLLTKSAKFKLPYTLSKYRKGINPVVALYEELQRSLFLNDNKFDKWIIQYVKDNKLEIINAIKYDLESIEKYKSKYHTIPDDLENLRNKFVRYLDFLEVFD